VKKIQPSLAWSKLTASKTEK